MAALVGDLERRDRGIRCRTIGEQDAVRPHMRGFVNGELVRDLATALEPSDDVHIVQALSGGCGRNDERPTNAPAGGGQ